MPIDIRKGNQIFGPHTVDDLKAFVGRGEIDLTDLVIKESGETVSVGEFLEQPTPLKLRVIPPSSPGVARVTAPVVEVPPRTYPTPVPPPIPLAYHSSMVRQEAEPEEKGPGIFPWLAAVAVVGSLIMNYKIAESRAGPYVGPGYIEGMAFGQFIVAPAVVLAINAARRKGRTLRGVSIALLIACGIQFSVALSSVVSRMNTAVQAQSDTNKAKNAARSGAGSTAARAVLVGSGWLDSLAEGRDRATAENKRILLLYCDEESGGSRASEFNRYIIKNRSLLARLEEEYVLIRLTFPASIPSRLTNAQSDALIRADQYRIAAVGTPELPAMAIVSADCTKSSPINTGPEAVMAAKHGLEALVLSAIADANKRGLTTIKYDR